MWTSGKRHFLSVALSRETYGPIGLSRRAFVSQSATDKDRNKIQPVERGRETHLLHRHPRRDRALLRARSTNWKQAWIAAHWSLVKHAGPHAERSQHSLIVSSVIPDTRASRSTNRRSFGNSTHEENPLAIDPGSRPQRGIAIAVKEG